MNGTAHAHRRGFCVAAISFATIVLSTIPAVDAWAQTPNSHEAACIVAINKSAGKVGKTQRKQIYSCVSAAGRGLAVAGGSVDACIVDEGAKLSKALGKTLAQESKRCADMPPFGYSGAATANAVVLAQEAAFVHDLFGSDISSSIIPSSSDPDGARCQAAITKRYAKLVDERVRAFVRCKSDGMKEGQISSAAELAACFDVVEQDAGGRIAKALGKLAQDYLKRCALLPNVAAAFPGDCASAPDILTCIDERVRCRTCLALNSTDNLDADCERMDNGAFDGSCVDPNANECAGENGGNNCSPNADCTDTTEGYTCACKSGFSGDGVICQDVDECATSTDNCDTNATCANTFGGFTCTCDLGYYGDGVTCTDYDECAGEGGGDNCAIHATCTNTPGGFVCECDAGYVGNGLTCTDANECVGEGDGNNCDPNAVCTNTPGSFICACLPGFVGDGVTCTDLNECIGEGSGNNCTGIAICTNLPGSFSCACPPGYSGDGTACTEINECLGEGSGNNCDANATCTNTPGSFTCTCNAGYGGDGVTCTDFDECAGEGSGNNCSPNAECTNTPGSFTCACLPGFSGNGVTCTDFDECQGQGGGNDCDVNATCANTPGSFTCTCNSGYIGDGTTCTDADECAGEGGGNNCSPYAICTNFEGGFQCACPAGFAGDGVTCTDFNECAGQNGGNNCNVNATCINTPGSFTCQCNTGWIGNGVTCSDANECIGEGPGNNCSANATCSNTIGSFNCTCNSGFTGDGVTCTDLNECIGQNGGNNCSANATCTNLPGTFSCSCNTGYQGDGVTCTDINECTLGTDNCSANATCTNTVGSFTCACNSGYQGDGVTCTDINECALNTDNCSVNATCSNTIGSFNCACNAGYYGNPFGSTCDPIMVQLTSPTHGVFTQAGSIGVTGVVTAQPISSVSLTINGSPVSIAANGSFSTTIPLSAPLIFNEVRAVLTQTASGYTTRDRRVVIVGPSANMGSEVTQSVGLRINDTGFNQLEPVLQSLVDFDIGTLLPLGTVVIHDVCFQDSFLGCIAHLDWAKVRGRSMSGFALDVDSMTNFVAGDVRLFNLFVDLEVHLTISGIGTTCDSFSVSASQTDIFGDYTLDPGSPDRTQIDVNLSGTNTVVFANFNDSVNCGGTGFLSALISAVKGDVQSTVRNALVDFLKDPDGTGPQDAVIAQAIEDALAAVELTGPIGEGFGVNLDTPLFAIPEDTIGITLASGAIMSPISPDPTAPQFTKTLVIPSTFPFSQLASQTSTEGRSYDMAIAIGDSAFNQILAAQVESGLLKAEISELDLLGSGTPSPLTAGLLSLFIPQFSQLPPSLPLRLKIAPTLAPVVTGVTGPSGEIAELVLSHLLIDVVSGPSGSETLYGRLAADLATAFDLNVEAGSGNLLPALSTPDPNDILITLLDNPLGMDEGQLQLLIPALLSPLVPSLSDLFGAFPLPQFLGLQPTAIEVSRAGSFMTVWLTVVPAP